jgi:hypothetical protein
VPLILLTVFAVAGTKEGIEGHTEMNLVDLRRVIYLTIMNVLSYKEAAQVAQSTNRRMPGSVYRPFFAGASY